MAFRPAPFSTPIEDPIWNPALSIPPNSTVNEEPAVVIRGERGSRGSRGGKRGEDILGRREEILQPQLDQKILQQLLQLFPQQQTPPTWKMMAMTIRMTISPKYGPEKETKIGI